MLQLTKPLAFIDLETTGVNLATDRIIEIAIVKVLPELTRSQMASAKPIFGAISTEPLISWMVAFIFFSLRYFERTNG